MSNSAKEKPIEWVECRFIMGKDNDGKDIKCGAIYKKWKQPFCRFHWNRFCKPLGYIYRKEDKEFMTEW